MRDHATITPQMWFEVRDLRGDTESLLLTWYLMTCPSSNMIGLYYLPIPIICHETGLSEKAVTKGLRRVEEARIAAYDTSSETVFVYEMAKSQVAEEMSPKDNRVKNVEKMLVQMRKSRFCKDFLEMYGSRFSLNVRGLEEALKQEDAKTLRSQEQEQDQDKDQEQDQEQDLGNPLDSSSAKADSQRMLRWERAFVERWNATPGVVLNRGDSLSGPRRKKFRARASEPDWPNQLKEALAKFPLKCFQSQDDPWRPDVDWILRPDSVRHVLEGKYDWSRNGANHGKENQQGRVRDDDRYAGIDRHSGTASAEPGGEGS